MCSNSSGSRSARITFCEKRNLRCTLQKKLRQGFGRAIRTEQDSCVVAILDERAGIGGKYHDAALAALPSCPTTEKIEDVQQFIREQKCPDYFL